MKYGLLSLLLLALVPMFYLASIAYVFSWDILISTWIQNSHAVALLSSVKILSIFGNYIGMTASFSTLILVALWLKGLVRAVSIAFVSLGQVLFIEILKFTIERPRPLPLGETNFDSFPSGQAFYSLVFFALVWFILNSHISKLTFRVFLIFLCILSTFTIGILRIHSGEHWPSDVVGSWLTGALLLCLFVFPVSDLVHRLRVPFLINGHVFYLI